MVSNNPDFLIKPKLIIALDALTKGGAQKVILTLIPEWINLGYKVKLVLIQNSELELDLNLIESLQIEIVRLNGSNMMDFSAFLKFLKIIVCTKPDYLQCHLYWAQMWGICSKIASRKTKIILVEHNTYLRRTKFQWFIYRTASIFASKIFAVSYEVMDYLKEHGIRNIKCVPNPISDKYFLSNVLERPNIFAFVGRFNSQKNPKYALEIFRYALINKYIPSDSKMLMIGEGPLFDEVVKYVVQNDLQSVVEFTGFLGENDLSTVLNNTKAVIMSSIQEGFPLVRLEALACGAAVVTTRTGGIRGLLTKDNLGMVPIDGVFVVENNLDSFANSMKKLMGDEYWTKSAIESRSFIADRFSRRCIAVEYFKF